MSINRRFSLPMGAYYREDDKNIIPSDYAKSVLQHFGHSHKCYNIHHYSLWEDIVDLFSFKFNLGWLALDDYGTPSVTLKQLKNIYYEQIDLISLKWISYIQPHVLRLRISIDFVPFYNYHLEEVLNKVPNLQTLEICCGSLLTNKCIEIILSKLSYLNHLSIYENSRIDDDGLLKLASAHLPLKTLCIIGSKSMQVKTFKLLINNYEKMLCAFCTIRKKE